MTTREAAEHLPYSSQALTLLAERGHLAGAVQRDGTWRIPPSTIRTLRRRLGPSGLHHGAPIIALPGEEDPTR